MQRIACAELLDEDLGTPEEISGNLDDLWRINRWLGGVSSNLTLLENFLRRTGCKTASILEVGAGDGRLAAYLRDRLRRRGVEADYVALDRRLSHINIGGTAALRLKRIVADALALPFREASFDVVTCNLFFHHFSGGSALALLRSMFSVARQAVLIDDLERRLVPYLFIRATPWFISNRMSRHDGPASVRQAYTRSELGAFAREAGFSSFDVRRLTPFRLGMTIWKKPSAVSYQQSAVTPHPVASGRPMRGLG